MKADPRSQQTEELIKRTFLELIKEKPLNKITVKELCSNAGINRTTFYKHYIDVYDLHETIETDLLANFRNLIDMLETNGIQETVIEMLRRIRCNAETYKALFGKEKESFFNEKLAEFIYNEITPMLCNSPLPATEEQKTWFYNFLVWGCGGFVHNWITSGMNTPEEEVAEFMESLIACNLKHFFLMNANDN